MSASTVKRKDDNSASVSASSEPELNSEEVRQAIEARKSRSGRGKRMHFLLENAKLEQEGDADEVSMNWNLFFCCCFLKISFVRNFGIKIILLKKTMMTIIQLKKKFKILLMMIFPIQVNFF